MNTQLMIPVERAVRPILASNRRKLQMREELYSLIEARYESLLAEGTSEEEAVQQATRAFGDPAMIRQELERTVPTRECLARRLDLFLYQDFHAPTVAQAIRSGMLIMIPLAIWMLGLCFAMTFVKPQGEIAALWPVLLTISLSFGTNTAFIHWLGPRSVSDILTGRWFRVAEKTLLVAAIFTLSIGTLYRVACWDYFLHTGWIAVLWSGPVSGGMYLLLCWLVSVERRQRAQWEELELAD